MFHNETSAFAFYTEGTPQYFYQKRQLIIISNYLFSIQKRQNQPPEPSTPCKSMTD